MKFKQIFYQLRCIKNLARDSYYWFKLPPVDQRVGKHDNVVYYK